MNLTKNPRIFLADNLKIDSFESVSVYYDDLIKREISSLEDFINWLKHRSELDAVLEEDAAWRYIKMTIDTTNQAYSKDYNLFITEIQPKLSPLDDALNKIQNKSPYKDALMDDEAYRIYFKSYDVQLQLFREENIPIEAELNELAQKYGVISAAQTIEMEGNEITMQKAAQYLKEQDESIREEAFTKMVARRRLDTEKLDELFTELIQKRHLLATNAGFNNFRDYKFESLGRFDYTKEDCFDFHNAIKTLIVPVVKEIQQKKLSQLGKEKFKSLQAIDLFNELEKQYTYMLDPEKLKLEMDAYKTHPHYDDTDRQFKINRISCTNITVYAIKEEYQFQQFVSHIENNKLFFMKL